MQLKIPVRNRCYVDALNQIGEILKEVEAAKEKKETEKSPHKKDKKELEKELEEDLCDIGEDNNKGDKNETERD